jgi:SEC-C motif-containing protein
MSVVMCPCGSEKQFKLCCEPFLSGANKPRTVQQLMRSRYSAYALGGYGDYLLATWHPRTAPKVSAAYLSTVEQKWLGLTVLAHTQQGNTGTVEFTARYAEEDGAVHIHHEISRFVRINGHWLYVDAAPHPHK